MMKKRHILHWAMGVVLTSLLGSCAADDIGGAGRDGCDIILGQPMAVTSVTRATDGRTLSNFESGEEVWLWANKADGSEYIKAWKLKAGSGGSFSSYTTGNDKYWPSDGSKLDVYALHGNFKNSPSISEGTTQWSSLTALTHTVETDQSSDVNKRLSDLLYSQAPSAASGQTVQLTFDHVLSKLCIKLQKDAGSGIQDADFQNATVKVSGINTEVTYDATNNTVTTSGTATTITLGQETSGSTTYEAIVPSGMTVTPSVKITLNNFPETGKTRTFSCDLSSVTFAKGNKYTFTLTLHNEIVVSEPTVNGWIEKTESVTIPQVTPD